MMKLQRYFLYQNHIVIISNDDFLFCEFGCVLSGNVGVFETLQFLIFYVLDQLLLVLKFITNLLTLLQSIYSI